MLYGMHEHVLFDVCEGVEDPKTSCLNQIGQIDKCKSPMYNDFSPQNGAGKEIPSGPASSAETGGRDGRMAIFPQ